VLWYDTNVSEELDASIFIHFTLKVVAANISDTLVSCNITTPRRNPDDLDLNRHRRENFKSRMT
jgi:hypothetical protein